MLCLCVLKVKIYTVFIIFIISNKYNLTKQQRFFIHKSNFSSINIGQKLFFIFSFHFDKNLIETLLKLYSTVKILLFQIIKTLGLVCDHLSKHFFYKSLNV